MLKTFIFCSALTLNLCAEIKKHPLNDPMLQKADGIPGMLDAHKLEKSIWLIQEIKHLHMGTIKVNEAGIPDPSHKSAPKDLMFRGKKHTLKELAELEPKAKTFTAEETAQFAELFIVAKDYFNKANNVIVADSQGMWEMMIKLIREFCGNRQRHNSLLLNWEKGKEDKLFNENVTTFEIFYIFTKDLKDFLSDLVISCPRAYADFKAQLELRKKTPKPEAAELGTVNG